MQFYNVKTCNERIARHERLNKKKPKHGKSFISIYIVFIGPFFSFFVCRSPTNKSSVFECEQTPIKSPPKNITIQLKREKKTFSRK